MNGGTCGDGCGGTCYGTKACVGTLTAQSFGLSASNTSCNTLAASTNTISGTTFSFNPAVDPASQTQGAFAVTWTNVSTNGTTNYGITAVPSRQFALGNICVSQNGGAWTAASAGVLTDGGTLSFRVGYIPQAGWIQTVTGNVYAATQLTASIPTTATYPYFSLISGSATPGIVTYSTDYDFSLSSNDKGENNVSTTGWLTQQTNLPIDWYERFAHQHQSIRRAIRGYTIR